MKYYLIIILLIISLSSERRLKGKKSNTFTKEDQGFKITYIENGEQKTQEIKTSVKTDLMNAIQTNLPKCILGSAYMKIRISFFEAENVEEAVKIFVGLVRDSKNNCVLEISPINIKNVEGINYKNEKPIQNVKEESKKPDDCCDQVAKLKKDLEQANAIIDEYYKTMLKINEKKEYYKEKALSFKEYKVTKSDQKNEKLKILLFTDGIWESKEGLANIVKSQIDDGIKNQLEIDEICKRLREELYNISKKLFQVYIFKGALVLPPNTQEARISYKGLQTLIFLNDK